MIGVHRKDIDGLRAVAVIPVVLSHSGLSWPSGGYVGVDVFFVISGYLIGGIIQSDIDAGRFSIAGFYERRIRRIFPALVVMALACVPAAWTIMLPVAFEILALSLVATVLFC